MGTLRSAFLLAVFLTPATTARAQNLLTNPDFDTDLSGWELMGSPTWSSLDAQDAAGSGSVRVSSSSTLGAQLAACVQVSGGQAYQASVAARATTRTSGVIPLAGVAVDWWSDADCATPTTGAAILKSTYYAQSWKVLAASGTAPAEAGYASVRIFVRKLYDEPGTLFGSLDDVYFGPIAQTTSTVTTTSTSVTSTTSITGAGCSDPVSPYGETTVSDALFVLRAAVGAVECNVCTCDTDASGITTGSDALRVLERAVGWAVDLHCGDGCAGS